MHYLQKAHLPSDTKLIDLADINIYDASVQTDGSNRIDIIQISNSLLPDKEDISQFMSYAAGNYFYICN